MVKFDKVSKKEKGTYIESMIFFVLFILTLTVLVVSGVGLILPQLPSSESMGSLMTNMLMIFIISELFVIILLLFRMWQK